MPLGPGLQQPQNGNYHWVIQGNSEVAQMNLLSSTPAFEWAQNWGDPCRVAQFVRKVVMWWQRPPHLHLILSLLPSFHSVLPSPCLLLPKKSFCWFGGAEAVHVALSALATRTSSHFSPGDADMPYGISVTPSVALEFSANTRAPRIGPWVFRFILAGRTICFQELGILKYLIV